MLSARFSCILCGLCFFVLSETVGADEAKCTRMAGLTDTKLETLRKTLLCKNDILSPPRNKSSGSGNRISVEIYLMNFHVEYEPDYDWFQFSTYVVLGWKDPRLSWKSENTSIHMIRVTHDEIWSPKFYLTSGQESRSKGAIIRADGKVRTIEWAVLSGSCKPIYFSWGDRRECVVSYGVGPKEEIELIADHELHLYSMESRASTWGITGLQRVSETENKSGSQPWKHGANYYDAQLTLQKNFAMQDDTIFAPAAVLSILLLTSTWMPAESAARVALLSLIILVEVCMFHQACQAMPYFADRLVNIVALYRDLIICTGAAILEWLAAYITAYRRPLFAQGLETAISTGTNNSPLLSTMTTVLLVSDVPRKGINGGYRNFFSTFLDRLTFLVLSVVLFILVIALAGRPPSAYEDLIQM